MQCAADGADYLPATGACGPTPGLYATLRAVLTGPPPVALMALLHPHPATSGVYFSATALLRAPLHLLNASGLGDLAASAPALLLQSVLREALGGSMRRAGYGAAAGD